MYDTLLQLPLFQGLCKDDFTSILEKVKFHFRNYNTNEVIVEQGDVCNRLIFLLDGEIASSIADQSHDFRLSEAFRPPFVIEPYSLFGLQTRYIATYRAKSPVKVLSIDKSFVLADLNKYEIFRLNFLNMLSVKVQTIGQKLWSSHIGTLEEKFVNFLLLRCTNPKGEKVLYIGMEELAYLINETRINVSRLLNDLQRRELVQLKRKEIFIPALERLAEELTHK